MSDDVMRRITEAVERGRAGDRAAAAEELREVWEESDDAVLRCSAAHFAADPQDDPWAELGWDERALHCADDIAEDVRRGYLPSLHLNLADVHRRLGHSGTARKHLDAAGADLDALPDGPYGELVRDGFRHVCEALDAGSTERLPTHP